MIHLKKIYLITSLFLFSNFLSCHQTFDISISVQITPITFIPKVLLVSTVLTGYQFFSNIYSNNIYNKKFFDEEFNIKKWSMSTFLLCNATDITIDFSEFKSTLGQYMKKEMICYKNNDLHPDIISYLNNNTVGKRIISAMRHRRTYYLRNEKSCLSEVDQHETTYMFALSTSGLILSFLYYYYNNDKD